MKRFDIERFMKILSREYKSWDAPVITLISNKGGTAFEILVSTLLSLRTKDEVTIKASERLFEKATTPEGILDLDLSELEKLIYPVGFYPTKSKRLKEISKILLETYDGRVPDNMEDLLKLPGVGRKTANLVLAEGFKMDAICVDTHVHRISNRIGYVSTKNPEQTEYALREKLPKKFWITYNEILVAFGQVLCRPLSPWCSRCPVSDICLKVGVERSR